MQVSVIVLTYNPDNQKLRQAIAAVAAQQEVSFELIISDDGSARKDFSFLPEYVASLGIKDWRLLEHAQNRGTVQSCLSAVEAAKGEYVFLTSPGDMLFDDTVLRDFYAFASENAVSLCFGDAVFYNPQTEELTRTVGIPAIPTWFAPQRPRRWMKSYFFSGNWAVGATYFRARVLALDTLRAVADVSVYTEDTTSSAFAIAAGERMAYMSRPVVWYEDGTGVSNSVNERWQRLLRLDLVKSIEKLKKLYPKDRYVDVLWRNLAQPNRVCRILGKLVVHPLIMLRAYVCRLARPKEIGCTIDDRRRLSALLSIQ